MAVKVCVDTHPADKERNALRTLRSFDSLPPVLQNSFGDFLVQRPLRGSTHPCFVSEAFSINLAQIKIMLFPDKSWPPDFFSGMPVREALQGLDFLHMKANLVHCGEIALSDIVTTSVDDTLHRPS